MLKPYIPLLLVLALAVVNAAFMLGLSHTLSAVLKTRRKTPTKLAPYESGMPVLGDARERFSVKFYLAAMLFIIFDIETVFMIPWAAAFQQLLALRGVLLADMAVFAVILAVGYVYVWKRGALQWD
jgi:NADH-quinone oxidoreductase subunit A